MPRSAPRRRRAARRTSGSAPCDRARAIGARAGRPGRSRAAAAVSWPGPPIEIGAHAGPELRHLLDGIGADRERTQVEIAGRASGAPARVFAFGRDQLYFNGDAA